ncbi:unnamed protein product [Adineta steineri]|uniref:PDZ domain-containing protein n=1 Tax=Adineta steineri TaxID=433720 RepID=A0A813MX17_9BILA|nr:unnamed protein product [Adineta steineri]CAF4095493.1 unnamed protein product [Adineta steineri]
MSIDLVQSQTTVVTGSVLVDPFLELSGTGITTPALQKSNKLDSSCVTNGALIGSIIGTLLLSALIGFLTWLIYLRPKFKELHYKHMYDNHKIKNLQQHHQFAVSSSLTPKRKQKINDDHNANPLPLDVTAYKFGTFPFRHSQTSSINSHYNRIDWLNRISSSFRSVNMDQDFEMIDIELLDPTFGGLNFSITGNMRAGIFIKEILDKNFSQAQKKSNSASNQLATGDRIMALTVCFDSIVYEDALTILSYASPYPVILRVQRPLNHTQANSTIENRPIAVTTPSKVKWRDDFEHYDNDTPINRSFVQPNPPLLPSTNLLPQTPLNSRAPPTTPKTRSSSKKTRSNANTQPRVNNKSSSTNKGNKLKTSSNSVLAASGATTKRCNNDIKKHRSKIHDNQRTLTNQMMLMSTGLTAKPPIKTVTPSTNKRTIPDSVISYLHYKGGIGGEIEQTTDVLNNSEATIIPYYDSPYDYCHADQLSQYQYLHQSHLNKNNNNSIATESLTAVTPNE